MNIYFLDGTATQRMPNSANDEARAAQIIRIEGDVNLDRFKHPLHSLRHVAGRLECNYYKHPLPELQPMSYEIICSNYKFATWDWFIKGFVYKGIIDFYGVIIEKKLYIRRGPLFFSINQFRNDKSKYLNSLKNDDYKHALMVVESRFKRIITLTT